MLGTTSAAPLGTFSRNKIPNALFPEFRHWPIDRAEINNAGDRVRRKSDEFQHGDGADMDNLAITSLLARGTESIISIVNTATPFRKPEGGCDAITDEHITDDIVSLFRPNDRLVHNVVFDGGNEELSDLCRAFDARKSAGEPLVHCEEYRVLQNDWYRIEPYETRVCWVYLDRVDGWIEKLDASDSELVADIIERRGSFDNFPHYNTFAEHGIGLIDLNRERVIALSNLAAWTVLESGEYIGAFLGIE